MIDRVRLVATFMDLVRIDSPSGHEAQIGERLVDLLRMLGASTERDEIGNVFARTQGKGEALLLNAHMDTVVPGEGVQPVLEEGVIRSDGRTILGGDDKSGIAIVLEVIRTAQEQGIPLPPLDVLFTVQEEIGLRGARAFDVSKLRARQGIGLDAGGPPGTIVSSAPSQDTLDVVVHGVAAHAGGEPEKGINAILVAAEAMTRMPLGRIDPETTANIGVIQGGRATNIVPDRVEIRGEARSRNAAKLTAQTEAMTRAFEEAAAAHGVTADIRVTRAYTAYALSPEALIVRLLMEGARAVGIEASLAPGGGGSDSNVFNAAGIEITNISTGMHKVHTLQECIVVDDMVRCAEWLLACLRLRAG